MSDTTAIRRRHAACQPEKIKDYLTFKRVKTGWVDDLRVYLL
jgi:hypothetical protein